MERQKVKVICDRVPGTCLRAGDITTVDIVTAQLWRSMGYVWFLSGTYYQTANMPTYSTAVWRG